MKKLVMFVILVLCIVKPIDVMADRVRCKAELSNKLTKDGFSRIILTCERNVKINSLTPLKMYVNKGMVVFDQPKKLTGQSSESDDVPSD